MLQYRHTHMCKLQMYMYIENHEILQLDVSVQYMYIYYIMQYRAVLYSIVQYYTVYIRDQTTMSFL